MDDLNQWTFLLIGAALGAAFGIGSSAIFWWIQNHLIVPKIEFAEEISKIKNHFAARGWTHGIKFKNYGKRSIIDVFVVARLTVRGLHYDNNRTSIYIPFRSNSQLGIPIISKITGNRVLRFRPDLIDFESLDYFPDHIKMLRERKNISIENLLELGHESFIIVYVTAFDSFSGAKKLFVSKKYKKSDVRKGKYRAGSGLEVVMDTLEIENWTDEFPKDEILPR